MNKLSVEKVAGGNGDVKIIDVRTPAEYEEAHIPGSVLVPLDEWNEERVKEFSGSECAIICQSGGRAGKACEAAEKWGVSSMSVVEGGIQAWESAGYHLERGKKTISLERQVRIAAGGMVLAGVILGTSVHPAWYGLSGFVGAGLMFSGITDWCGMGMLMAKMPWNRR